MGEKCMKHKMKHKMIGILAIAFTLGSASSVFAYSDNPYVDVPRDHWAYGVVDKLTKAGIIEGYQDNTFKGDKVLTRYEMATIIAKAMTKYDKADTEEKAAINKLKVEFADDLENQGVRLRKVEKRLEQSKISGEYKVVYQDMSSEVNGVKQKSRVDNLFYSRARIVFTGNIDDLDYEFRLQNVSDLRAESGADGTTSLNRSNVGGKMFGGKWRFGTQADHNLDLWVTDATIKGVSGEYRIGKVDVVGRFGKEYVPITSYFSPSPGSYSSIDEHTVLTASTTVGKTFVGVGYHNLSFSGRKDPYNVTDDNRSIYELAAHGNIAPNLLLSAAYSKSTADFENTGYNVSLEYGKVNPAIVHSQSFKASYHYAGISSTYQPNGDYSELLINVNGNKVLSGFKGLALAYNYVPRKSTALVFKAQPNNKTIHYGGKTSAYSVTGYFFF